jgi:hypothetical protein
MRRVFCDNAQCSHPTCAEHLPTLLRPPAHCTWRLQSALPRLALALGGTAGARLGRSLSLPTSPESVLRLVRQAERPAKRSAKIIGSAAWAYRGGLRDGTLSCDLETRKRLDLLPDRSVGTTLLDGG